jgi:hypothetical protein
LPKTEGVAGVLHDLPAEHRVADASQGRSDAEGHRAPDQAGALLGEEVPGEGALGAVGELADEERGEAPGDDRAPVLVEPRSARELPRDLAHELAAGGAHHQREHQRAGALRVLEPDAVHLGHRLREEGAGLEEPDGSRSREGHGGGGPDPGNDGGRSDRRTAGGDARQVLPLERGDELLGSRVRTALAERADVGQHGRPLDGEHAIEDPRELRRVDGSGIRLLDAPADCLRAAVLRRHVVHSCVVRMPAARHRRQSAGVVGLGA